MHRKATSTAHTRLIMGVMLLGFAVAVPRVEAQWVRATIPPPAENEYFLDVFFLPSAPQYGWACGQNGYVVRTTDAGKTWRVSRPGRVFLEYVQFLTPLVGYTSGPAGIYQSTDGGASWVDITPFDPNGSQSWGSYFLNQNEGVYLAGGCNSVQTFFHTSDGGSTFTPSYQTEPGSGLSDALLYKDGTGFAVSSGVIWSTSDFGRRWRKYSTTGAKVWHEELSIIGNTFMIPTSGSDCSGQGDGIGSVLTSHDRGMTWTSFNTRNNMFGTCLIDEDHGWAAGRGRSAYYTSDGGKTWTNRNCGIEGDLDDVYFLNDTLGWIAGAGLYKFSPRSGMPEVTIDPPGPIIDICEGDSVLLTGSLGYTSYSWSDGVKAQSRYASQEGRYTLNAYDAVTCTESKAQVTLRFYPGTRPRISAAITEVCEGDSVRLELVVADPVSKRWSTGDTTESVYVKTSGTYTVTTVDQYGCNRTTAPVNVTIHPTPVPRISANRSTTICLDESVTLSAPPGYKQYQWSNGSTESSITVSTAGVYTVTVTDEFGCVGTSADVTVVVLDTRNKVGIQSQLSPEGSFIIPDAVVGSLSCREIAIRNLSSTEDLVVRDPTFIGNVFCSIPQGQLPITIPPNGVGMLNLCCSALDTGVVRDTLILTDTCSPTYLPVQGYGLSLQFNGTSRCNVPVDVLIIRAGVSYYLYPPYPLPANDRLHLQIAPPMPEATGYLLDALGNRYTVATSMQDGDRSTILFDTSLLPRGAYIAVVEAEGTPPRGYPVVIVH
jgi:photosystem II stability/assembly factor-like uncharacterized protein